MVELRHVLCFLTFFSVLPAVTSAGVHCHKPDLRAAIEAYERSGREDSLRPKFVEFSCTPEHHRYDHCSTKGGIGNSLLIYPAAYLFAMISGRELIIQDSSVMGSWCRALHCGFNFTSEVENLFPNLTSAKHVPRLNGDAFAYKIRTKQNIKEDVVGAIGLDTVSTRWFHYAGRGAAECVHNITGCHSKGLGCVEKYAFHQLLAGGFHRGVVPSNVVGISQEVVKRMLSDPYDSLPRFDAGVHIRAQTAHLEDKEKRNVTDVEKDKSYYGQVFHYFKTMLQNYFFEQTPVRFNASQALEANRWPLVFLSCDDEEIRDGFVEYMYRNMPAEKKVILAYVNSSDVIHTKHSSHKRNFISQGIIDAAFDWYALSLSQKCFAWRKKYTGVVSTFLQSATRVSINMSSMKEAKIFWLAAGGKWHAAFDFVDYPVNSSKK